MFVLIGFYMNKKFTTDELSLWGVTQAMFSAFNGEQDFGAFEEWQGQTFLILFILINFILLLNLLIAMFSNTYQRIYENKNAIRLKRILEMKNHLSHEPIIGSVTTTFFPINILMIPFMPVVILVKNKKLNEMVNKIQYSGLIFLLSVAITILQFCLTPIMYAKIILNSFNIMITSQNQTGIERYLEPFFSIIAGPFIIILSILTDLITLPTVLLYSEHLFEEKY
jgi:hypothetical protein